MSLAKIHSCPKKWICMLSLSRNTRLSKNRLTALFEHLWILELILCVRCQNSDWHWLFCGLWSLPTMSACCVYVTVSFWAHPLPLPWSAWFPPSTAGFQSPSAAYKTTLARPFLGRRGLWSWPSRQVAHESSSKDSLTAFLASASYPQLLQGWSIELLPCWSQRMRTKTSKDSGQWDLISSQSTLMWIFWIGDTCESACGVNHMDQHVFSPFETSFVGNSIFLSTNSTLTQHCHHLFSPLHWQRKQCWFWGSVSNRLLNNWTRNVWFPTHSCRLALTTALTFSSSYVSKIVPSARLYQNRVEWAKWS